MTVGSGSVRLQRRVDQWDGLLNARVEFVLEALRAVQATGSAGQALQELERMVVDVASVAEGIKEDLSRLTAEAGLALEYESDRKGAAPAHRTRAGAMGSPGPSDEQLAVQECDAHEITVNAFAGSGKTTSCIGYAKARPRKRFLYVAFNKSVQMEASRRFTANVECKTSHGLAFGAFGAKYANAGKLGTPRARELMEFLDARVRMPVATPDEKYHLAQIVLRRVLDYMQSMSLERTIGKKGTDDHYTLLSNAKIPGSLVAEYANLAWGAMQDLECRELSMPHDGYLKLYALSQPQLTRYDGIILDECQDTNMAVFGFVGRQETGKLLVGDVHQSIYQFRGAVNVMDKLRNAQRLALTKSFRFGPQVAEVANSILGVFCGEKLSIQGCGTSEGKGDKAYLYRTNAGLFGGVVNWMEVHGRSGQSIHLVGGVEGYGLDAIKDSWYLKAGEEYAIQDPFLRKFRSYDQLCDYADAVDDKEIKARIKVVDQYGQRIPELVEQVKVQDVAADRAAAQATTAHKAKGLEWTTVVLGDDFPNLMSDSGVPRHVDFVGKDGEPLDRQECNLYYVASTRAQGQLVQNQSLRDFMLWCRTQHA
jgi:F-box protein 18 (helicase)